MMMQVGMVMRNLSSLRMNWPASNWQCLMTRLTSNCCAPGLDAVMGDNVQGLVAMKTKRKKKC